jgi:hypothetical protein
MIMINLKEILHSRFLQRRKSKSGEMRDISRYLYQERKLLYVETLLEMSTGLPGTASVRNHRPIHAGCNAPVSVWQC